jgi:TonB-dependent starch-binding outer membrane protein SusC
MKNIYLKRLYMASKITLYGLIIQTMLFTGIFAMKSEAQVKSIKDVKLSVDFKEVQLKKAFSILEKETGFHFTYNDLHLRSLENITLAKKNTNLAEILLDISAQSKLHFRQINNTITVKPLPEGEKFEEIEIVYQTNTISGRVTTSDTNEGLPGVNVVIKGTLQGTVTDINGNYSIDVRGGETILVFSSVGYISEEVQVGNRNMINISMTPDITALQEIVVVGFGTQNKRDVTGSISSVKFEDVKTQAVASPEALLQGKAAGVQIVQNSGMPGGEVFVRVRGTASLLGESRPLFVVDGVPLNFSTAMAEGGQRLSPLADINPNDIESIDILKDAAATAIYGSRGSNGVVLITTKRGKTGAAKISFDAYTGVQSVWRQLDMLDGTQYVDLVREAITNRDPNLLNDPIFQELAPTGFNTNYQDEIFRNAPISNYSLSVSGGNDRLTSFISLNYFNQQGTIIGQNFERFSTRFNIDYQATKRLKVGTSTTLSNTVQDRIDVDFSGLSVLANALIRNPNLPVRNQDGTYSVDPFRTENPVKAANDITFQGNQRRVVFNTYAEYQILEGLTFRSVLGIDYNDDRTNRFIPSTMVQRDGVALARAWMLDEQTLVNDNTLNYRKVFNNDHNLNMLIGYGIQKSTLNSLTAGGQDAGTDILKTIGAISVPFIPGQTITGWGIKSYFGRVNYGYQDKYLAEASFRVDGSSRFGANQRYGVFPGLSLGWRVSEEMFMKESTFITDLKLRAGIGVTGNQDGIGNFAARALYGTGRNYDGNPGIGQINIPNLDLGWEATTTTNIGIDFSVFNGRVSLIADAYLKNTDNLIFPFQLPWTSGFSNIGNANIGTMENRGLEIALNTRNTTGAFKWTTDFNISFNRVKITNLPENGSAGSDFVFQLPSAFGVEGPYNVYRIGAPVGSFFGYVYDGVYARDEDVPEALFNRGIRGGDARFIDLNDDGVFDRQNDRTIIGNALPQHIGGITNTFSYRNFELNILFNWSYGNDMYNMTRAVLTSMSDEFNQTTDALRRWRQQGDITDIPRALYGTSSVAGNAATDASSRYIEDASFLRMRNATFSYNLPENLLERLGMSSARIYVSGQNLITITNYSGFDPENQNVGTGVPLLGVDYLTQPQPRTIMLGVNIGL